jgi:hypothetical protein
MASIAKRNERFGAEAYHPHQCEAHCKMQAAVIQKLTA